jgi:biopolymer transport protein ExbD
VPFTRCCPKDCGKIKAMSDLTTRVWSLTALGVFLLIGLVLFALHPTSGNDGLQVQLPESLSTGVVPDRPPFVRLTLKADGHAFVGHDLCSAEQLLTCLRRQHERNPRSPLVINADRRLSYGTVRNALQSGSLAGFSQLYLGAEAAPRESLWSAKS